MGVLMAAITPPPWQGLPPNTPTVIGGVPGDYDIVATATQNGSGNIQIVPIPGGPTDLRNQVAANATTIQAKVLADLTTIEAWITANPTGAVLTGPQTLVLAKMLAGLCRLVLNDTSTTGAV